MFGASKGIHGSVPFHGAAEAIYAADVFTEMDTLSWTASKYLCGFM